MGDERKYRLVVVNDDAYGVIGTFDGWQAAMDEAIRLGIGRKTSEADTYELNAGVEIRAEPI